MATGLDIGELNTIGFNLNDIGFVSATKSTNGAYNFTSVGPNAKSDNVRGDIGSKVVGLDRSGAGFIFIASKNSANQSGTLFLSYSKSGTSRSLNTIDTKLKLVGWNQDGLLFSGAEPNSYLFIADPGGPAAGAGGVPVDTTFNTNSSDIPFGLDPITVPCFAAGVSITTPAGGVAVEALRVGDTVLTASGATRPVIWIGQKTVRPARHPRPHEVNPVRIRKGAFAEGLPARDLVVSPGHAVFVEGVLIPAGSLVNGATIIQETVDSVRYFHVELDAHDVVLADGLPCESYLDDGNRAAFANGGQAVELFGRLDPKSWEKACAPWVGAGPQLDEVRRRLHARAEAMGWVRSEEPDLHLVVDGVTIGPLQTHGDRAWFQVPACAALTLASNTSVLAQVMPGLHDTRRLGVAVGELRVNGQALALDGAVFGAGFHTLETYGDYVWRWTDGAATLALGLDAPAMIEVVLHMVAPSWKRRAPELRLVAAG
jgi:hypothetical protein